MIVPKYNPFAAALALAVSSSRTACPRTTTCRDEIDRLEEGDPDALEAVVANLHEGGPDRAQYVRAALADLRALVRVWPESRGRLGSSVSAFDVRSLPWRPQPVFDVAAAL